ncbi:MAG: cyclic nucleotide-binding domain-containing protein [Spirochaetota bacterium]
MKEKETDWYKLRSLYKEFRADTTLLQEGNAPKAMYVLISGMLEVYKGDKQLATIQSRGEYIGEISLLLDIPHSATVKTLTDSILIEISPGTFMSFMTHTPEVAISLAKKIAERLVVLNKMYANAIRKMIAKKQSKPKIEAVAELVTDSGGINLEKLRPYYRKFPKDTVIINEGDKPKAMYIIVEGELEIVKDQQVIAIESQPGYYLGEVSILRNASHNATVRTKIPSVLIEISAGKAFSFFKHSPEIAISVSKKLAQRILIINGGYIDILEPAIEYEKSLEDICSSAEKRLHELGFDVD